MRKCALDLAPEAPWQCPADCTGYEPRRADVNWRHGSLVTPPTPAAPDSVGADSSVGALLDEAERIVNLVGSEVQAEVAEEQALNDAKLRKKWWPFRRG